MTSEPTPAVDILEPPKIARVIGGVNLVQMPLSFASVMRIVAVTTRSLDLVIGESPEFWSHFAVLNREDADQGMKNAAALRIFFPAALRIPELAQMLISHSLRTEADEQPISGTNTWSKIEHSISAGLGTEIIKEVFVQNDIGSIWRDFTEAFKGIGESLKDAGVNLANLSERGSSESSKSTAPATPKQSEKS